MATTGLQPPSPLLPDEAAGRDEAAEHRDDVAEARDTVADARDEAGDDRDGAADQRDIASSWRDVMAARRDAAAEERDADAHRHESVTPIQQDARGRAETVRRAAVARWAAASDRLLAYEDRQAGAGEREEAEQDRSISQADRDSGAAEREQAESDRGTAGEDRGAAAVDRRHASLDGLTGAYVRSAGLLQLEREVLRTQRTKQPLTLAFVEVDQLKAINDAGGHAAGDRLLVRVADLLRARLRPYDLVVRHGGDEFVCGLTGMPAEKAARRFAAVNSALAGAGSVTVGLATAVAGETCEQLVARAARGARRQEQRGR